MMTFVATAVVFLLSSPLSFAMNKIKLGSIEFSSKENLSFQVKGENEIADFTKAKSFQGYLVRSDETVEDLKTVDVYQLKKTKINRQSCAQSVSEIIGSKSTLIISAIKIANTHFGNICLVKVSDPDAKAVLTERQILIGTVHGQTVGFSFLFKKPYSNSENDILNGFWKNIR